jgi:hypothetical protein
MSPLVNNLQEAKMQDTKLSSRRDFLALAATATAGLGMMAPVAGAAAAAGGPATDFTRWLDSIPGKHRQVTDWPDLNGGMGLGYSLAFLMTGPIGYGVPESEIGVVLVIRHNTIPIALNDSAWAKYKLGEMFNITDPDTNAPAVRNPFYLKPGSLPFPDAALQKLIDRGVKVGACNLAITFASGMAAEKFGLKPEDVKKDWLDAVYPGITVLPSGILGCNGAVSRGCVYVFAG